MTTMLTTSEREMLTCTITKADQTACGVDTTTECGRCGEATCSAHTVTGGECVACDACERALRLAYRLRAASAFAGEGKTDLAIFALEEVEDELPELIAALRGL